VARPSALPRKRWAGLPRSRIAPDWRPFTGALLARSDAYALSVPSALFRWLIACASSHSSSVKLRAVSSDTTRVRASTLMPAKGGEHVALVGMKSKVTLYGR